MSFTAALYEGDSVIHREFRRPAAGSEKHAPGRRAAPQVTVLERAELAWAEIRGLAALLEMAVNAVKTVVLWIDEKSQQAHYRRVESFLGEATDHADLERRIRQLERSNQLNWIDCASR